MKFKSVLLAILAVCFVIGFSACSKSPKDRVIRVHEKFIEWVNSDNFESTMISTLENNQENLDNVYMKKIDDLILSSGFASREDFDTNLRKLKGDPDIIELNKKIDTILKPKTRRVDSIIREKRLKMLQEQMQNQQTTTPDTTAHQ